MKLTESTYLEYFDALITGNRDKCAEIVDSLQENKVELIDLYEKLFQRSMYRIGKLWNQNKITVAEEHIATYITDTLVDVVCSRLNKAEKKNKTIVVTCVEKEFHCIGAKIIVDYFEFLGWDVIMLGANTPVSELLKVIEDKKPDLIGISNSFYLNILRLLKFIETIQKKFPDQKIIVGGQALSEGKDDLLEKYRNVNYIASLREIDAYLKEKKI